MSRISIPNDVIRQAVIDCSIAVASKREVVERLTTSQHISLWEAIEALDRFVQIGEAQMVVLDSLHVRLK